MRIVARKPLDRRCDEHLDCKPRRRQPHEPSRGIIRSADRRDRVVEQRESGRQILQEPSTGLRHRHGPRGSVEQALTDPILKGANRMAERRSGQAEIESCPPKTTCLCYRNERARLGILSRFQTSPHC
jgi:hypothetical protein